MSVSSADPLLTGEWIRCASRTYGRSYWHNRRTGENSWLPPKSHAEKLAEESNSMNLEFMDPRLVMAAKDEFMIRFDGSNNDPLQGVVTALPLTPEDLEKIPPDSEHFGKPPLPCTVLFSGVTGQPLYHSRQQDIIEAMVAERDSMDPWARILKEHERYVVGHPDCPRLQDTIDIPHLLHRLRTEKVPVSTDFTPEFEAVFILPDDETGLITRAIQEDQIHNTRLKLRRGKEVVDLPSFWEVWASRPDFRAAILGADDQQEAKWQLQIKFSYKLATTFMPAYAKSIYEYFNAESVLDPCSGWGDRMLGAATASCVRRYVAFDPNRTLRYGYAKTLEVAGVQLQRSTTTKMEFSNNFEMYALPFEDGATFLPSESFDLVFTSPPFFDYEMYTDINPKYSSWIDSFYKPLFIHAARLVKPGHHVCIHIGDTSAGEIEKFLHEEVKKICPLTMVTRLGLKGVVSNKTRTVWVYRKSVE